MFEFLELLEDKLLLEMIWKRCLYCKSKSFLELGHGFMFVGTQQRLTYNNRHYYVDIVLYNKISRLYVLVELKPQN